MVLLDRVAYETHLNLTHSFVLWSSEVLFGSGAPFASLFLVIFFLHLLHYIGKIKFFMDKGVSPARFRVQHVVVRPGCRLQDSAHQRVTNYEDKMSRQ